MLFAVWHAENAPTLTAGSTNRTASVVVVVIPEGASSQSPTKNFEPSIIRVVIGSNSTVRWINQDSVPALIGADNESDPAFYNATKDYVFIGSNKTFEYTFTKAGEFGYHGRPWQRGTVIVVAAASSDTPSPAKLVPRLADKDAPTIVAHDILIHNPDSEIIDYPLSKRFPIMLYYFANDGRRMVIDPDNNYQSLGACDPSKLFCYPQYKDVEIRGHDEDRLAYAIQVLVKKNSDGGAGVKDFFFDDTSYYLVSANTGKIIYTSESETKGLDRGVKPDSFCMARSSSSETQPYSLVKEPSTLPHGYHCVLKQGRQQVEGTFVYWDREPQGGHNVPLWADSKDALAAIQIEYQKLDGGQHHQQHMTNTLREEQYQSLVDDLRGGGFQARLTHINGSPAFVREQCDVCGMTTMILFEYRGYGYHVESGLPSTTLIPILTSLR
jgi:plastocyanin